MIELIKYKGREYPMKYDYYAMAMLRKEKEEAEIENRPFTSTDIVATIYYYSIEAGCEEKNVSFTVPKTVDGEESEVPFTMKDILFMTAKVGPEEMDRKLQKFIPKIEDDIKDSKKKSLST